MGYTLVKAGYTSGTMGVCRMLWFRYANVTLRLPNPNLFIGGIAHLGNHWLKASNLVRAKMWEKLPFLSRHNGH